MRLTKLSFNLKLFKIEKFEHDLERQQKRN